MNNGKKFYEQTWFLWVTLIFFAPIGIILMYHYKRFHPTVRLVLSIFFGLVFISAIITGNEDDNQQTSGKATTQIETTDDVEEVSATDTPSPTPEPTATPEPTPTLEPTATPIPTLSPEEIKAQEEAQAEADYYEWVENQFSLWDGSNRFVVDFVKENMNDPKSFDHVETSYRDEGVGKGITVYMVYRGSNAFGAIIKTSVTAYLDYQAQTIKIISEGD